MNRLAISLVTACLFSCSTTAQEAQTAKVAGKATTADTGSSSVERGRYLVEHVAMCGRCHTPNNQAGEAGHRNWLMGGPLQIQPTYPIPNWCLVTPRIAGSPPDTDDEFVRLLTQGIAHTGAPPRPPMPNFGMSRGDAASILAYLKSLPK